MSAASTIVIAVVTIGASAALGAAHQQGWGGFGEFGQSMASASVHDTCQAPASAVAWSSGVGSQSLARTRALVKWSKKARLHGPDFASWHNARGRNISCQTRSDNDAKCVVRGRPCQSVAELAVNLDQLF